jgi:PEP-CTERM motif
MRRICRTMLWMAAASLSVAYGATLTVDFTNGNKVDGSGSAAVSGGTGTAIFDASGAPTTVGTGVIDSFVRIDSNTGSEQGYNTDANGVMDNKAGIFTHSLTLSELDSATKPGFYTFLLDINQTKADPLLSLDDLKLFYAPTGNLADQTLAGLQGDATQVYDFQSATTCGAVTGQALCTSPGGAHNEILLNYAFNNGSGNGFDMFFFVPTSVFAGAPANSFVYLYSAFGGVGGDFAANDGFEEWARISATGQVPEPSSLWILMVAAVALLAVDYGRRRRFAKAEN